LPGFAVWYGVAPNRLHEIAPSHAMRRCQFSPWLRPWLRSAPGLTNERIDSIRDLIGVTQY
jgi:hypothetical protein